MTEVSHVNKRNFDRNLANIATHLYDSPGSKKSNKGALIEALNKTQV